MLVVESNDANIYERRIQYYVEWEDWINVMKYTSFFNKAFLVERAQWKKKSLKKIDFQKKSLQEEHEQVTNACLHEENLCGLYNKMTFCGITKIWLNVTLRWWVDNECHDSKIHKEVLCVILK